jgi:hypothetical protein
MAGLVVVFLARCIGVREFELGETNFQFGFLDGVLFVLDFGEQILLAVIVGGAQGNGAR